MSSEVKNFYSKIQFPGKYNLCDLKFYKNYKNSFLEPYIEGTRFSNRVLDIGCGTGFITNLLAMRYPQIHIDAIDFSESINIAEEFSKKHKFTNVKYYKTDFFEFFMNKKYDTIISNGVIHHMPEYVKAFEKIQECKPNRIILGVYNKYGKFLNQFVKFRNTMLYQDQIHVPYETSWTDKQVREFLCNYECKNVYPSIHNNLVDFRNLFNRKNGGLTIYTFTQKT